MNRLSVESKKMNQSVLDKTYIYRFHLPFDHLTLQALIACATITLDNKYETLNDSIFPAQTSSIKVASEH